MHVEDIKFVVSNLDQFLGDYHIKDINESLNEDLNYLRVRGINAAREWVSFQDKFTDFIDSLENFHVGLWTSKELQILNGLGFSEILGEGRDLATLLQNLHNNDLNLRINTASDLINKVKIAVEKFEVLKKGIDFLIDDNIEIRKVDDQHGLIEIIFNNKVSIDNFDDAKSQMKSWYLIIEGYSRLLGIPRDEFEIIGFSKNSPTKIKVQVRVDIAKIIATITSFVLGAYVLYLNNSQGLQNLEQSEIIDSEAKTEIQKLKDSIESGIEKRIQSIVDQEISKRFGPDDEVEDVRNALNQGLINQFRFTKNGGDINLFINQANYSEEIRQFEKVKQQIHQLERPSYNQKLIVDTTDLDNKEKEEELGE